MTNDEARMTIEATMTNDETLPGAHVRFLRRCCAASPLLFRHSLVIRISSFVIAAA
jgi:hypothetical protein